MPNQRHNPMTFKKGASNDLGGGTIPPFKESTAAWPGVPGKTQSRSRNVGIKKVKQAVKSEGI